MLENGGVVVLVVIVVGSVFAFLLCNLLIPSISELLVKAGRTGRDLSKIGKPLVPESGGIIVGGVYLFTLFLLLPAIFLPYFLNDLDFFNTFKTSSLSTATKATPITKAFPSELLGAYCSGLLSICTMLFMGLADDLLNLKWRHKVLLPAISSLPLLIVYFITNGRTAVLLPPPFSRWLGMQLVSFGAFYYLYMGAMTIFCTHSINILAGINGVEVGQVLVIAIGLVVHSLVSLCTTQSLSGRDDWNLLIIALLLPLVGVCSSFIRFNWRPAKIFPGDTFCYFSGMTLAVSGILGHSGKTLIPFFLPQIINFCLSLPQLLKIIPCPRHRIPEMVERGKEAQVVLRASSVQLKGSGHFVSLLKKIGLVYLRKDGGDVKYYCYNLTIINIVLLLSGGELEEGALVKKLILIQSLTAIITLILRHLVVRLFY